MHGISSSGLNSIWDYTPDLPGGSQVRYISAAPERETFSKVWQERHKGLTLGMLNSWLPHDFPGLASRMSTTGMCSMAWAEPGSWKPPLVLV